MAKGRGIGSEKTIVFPNSSTDHGFLFKTVFCRSEIPVSKNKVRFMRSAGSQIRALFERLATAIFPPPGPDVEDSFFAIAEAPPGTPARLYIGIAAQGRSLKVIMLRTALALMSVAKHSIERTAAKQIDSIRSTLT
jgi:hypothetical protein